MSRTVRQPRMARLGLLPVGAGLAIPKPAGRRGALAGSTRPPTPTERKRFVNQPGAMDERPEKGQTSRRGPMLRMIFLSALLAATACAGSQDAPPVGSRPETDSDDILVMVVGTYHMAGSQSDLINPVTDSVLTERAPDGTRRVRGVPRDIRAHGGGHRASHRRFGLHRFVVRGLYRGRASRRQAR